MSTEQKIAVVTGANKGLGLETSRQLAKLGFHVVLTARNHERGVLAARQLQEQGLTTDFHVLDVAVAESVHSFAKHMEKSHGRIDVLVNNAGVFLEPMDSAQGVTRVTADTILKTFQINTLGALRTTQALLPLMQGRPGRIVNVSSGLGALEGMEGSWPAYRISKTALNAITRMLAHELRETAIKVNSVCPGWVRTDMGGPRAERSPEQGARTIVWAATLPPDGPTGGFFRDEAAIPW